MLRTVVPLLVLGCAEAPVADDAMPLVDGEVPWFDAPPAEGAAPPPLPQVMTLSSDAPVPGGTTLLEAINATPGDTVTFLRGSSPGSTCPPPLGGDCLDLGSPKILGTAVANALGDAVLAISLPVAVPVGVNMHVQAMVSTGSPYASDVLSGVTSAVCGDLIQQSSETCDDGNAVADDGCSDLCLTELCGDGVVQPSSEGCDDGNTVSGDGCSDLCVAELVDEFDMFVDRATYTPNHPSGGDWDFDPFGVFIDPDPYYVVWVDATVVYQSNEASDTRFPIFNDQFPITVMPGQTLYVDFWDADVIGAEFAGTLSYDHAELNARVDTGSFTDSDGGVQSATLEFTTP